MARKGRTDRGLVMKKDAGGKAVWSVRLWHEGKERRFGAFATKTQAREFYEKAKLEQKEGRFFPERFQRGGYAKLEDVITRYMNTNANRSVRDDRRYARFWIARFPGARLNAVTPAAIDAATQTLTAAGLAPGTLAHYLKFLRHVFNLAIRDGTLERNPLRQAAWPKVSKGRLRFLTLEEETRLAQAIGPRYAPWVRFAILTGLRRREQFMLRWADVDLERGLLTLLHTKAGGVQYAHLNEEAKALLRGLDSWHRSVWVFPSENPATPIDPNNFYRRAYVPALQAAGLEGVTWHTLRHTFASRLAMDGATEGDIAACLRHSTTALVNRYAHLSPTHLKGVMEKVSAFGRRAPAGSPTVTKTGTAAPAAGTGSAEVVEKIGAGDGI